MQKYRSNPPSLAERLRLAAAFLLILLVPFLFAGWLIARLDIPGALPLLAGLYLGMAAHEAGAQRRFVHWWPLTHAITDWNRVDQLLLGQSEVAPPAAAPAPRPRWRWALAIGLLGFSLALAAAFGLERALAYVYDPRRDNPPESVIILTTSWCGYCRSLRQHLAELGIPYAELDTEKTSEGRWAFAAVRARGVPVTIVGDQVIHGLGRGSPWERVDGALADAGYDIAPALPQP